MSVDPNIDYMSHDPSDDETPSDDPRLREVQELEKRMRAALATKENPLHDDESTHDRLKRTTDGAEGDEPEADEPGSED